MKQTTFVKVHSTGDYMGNLFASTFSWFLLGWALNGLVSALISIIFAPLGILVFTVMFGCTTWLWIKALFGYKAVRV